MGGSGRLAAVLALVIHFALGQDTPTGWLSTYDPCKCSEGTDRGIDCVCVQHYQCDIEGTGFLYLYGEGILDDGIRATPVEICPGKVQVCCKVPPSVQMNVTQSPLQPPGQPEQPVTPSPDTLPGLAPGVPPSALPQCGTRRREFALLGGWEREKPTDLPPDEYTAFAEFPWMLAIFGSKDGATDSRFLCGASLVSWRVALTAAHCIDKATISSLQVRAGDWDLGSTDEPVAHQERRVSEVSVHPEFLRKALFNNVALLKLDQPFKPMPNVGLVCLPPPSFQYNGSRCIATGWGAKDSDRSSVVRRRLRLVELPVVPNQKCQDRLRTTRLGIYFVLDRSFMCAGGEEGKDTCKGDGGGPLACPSADDPLRFEQAGIVSWGIGCKSNSVPAVYADVAHARPWIDSQLQLLDP